VGTLSAAHKRISGLVKKRSSMHTASSMLVFQVGVAFALSIQILIHCLDAIKKKGLGNESAYKVLSESAIIGQIGSLSWCAMLSARHCEAASTWVCACLFACMLVPMYHCSESKDYEHNQAWIAIIRIYAGTCHGSFCLSVLLNLGFGMASILLLLLRCPTSLVPGLSLEIATFCSVCACALEVNTRDDVPSDAKNSKSEEAAALAVMTRVCDAVMYLDHELFVARWSSELTDLLGERSSEQLQGLSFTQFLPQEGDKTAFLELISQPRPSCEAEVINVVVQDADTDDHLVMLIHSQFVDARGNCVHLIGLKIRHESLSTVQDHTKHAPKRVMSIASNVVSENDASDTSIHEGRDSSDSVHFSEDSDLRSTEMSAWIDAGSELMPIMQCSPGLNAIAGPSQEGMSFLSWLSHDVLGFRKWQFQRWLQNILRAPDEEVEALAVELQPPHLKLAQATIQAKVSVDIKRTQDNHQKELSADEKSVSAAGTVSPVLLVLHDVRWCQKRTSSKQKTPASQITGGRKRTPAGRLGDCWIRFEAHDAYKICSCSEQVDSLGWGQLVGVNLLDCVVIGDRERLHYLVQKAVEHMVARNASKKEMIFGSLHLRPPGATVNNSSSHGHCTLLFERPQKTGNEEPKVFVTAKLTRVSAARAIKERSSALNQSQVERPQGYSDRIDNIGPEAPTTSKSLQL